MTCHNCLQNIDPKTQSYRRILPPGRHSKPIYIHSPRCPPGADPSAHFYRLVQKGLVKV